MQNKLREIFSRLRPAQPFLMKKLIGHIPEDSLQQAPESLDCGIIVCNLIESFYELKRMHKGEYNLASAANYRSKMVRMFLDVDNVIA